jgi:hypothetical protein
MDWQTHVINDILSSLPAGLHWGERFLGLKPVRKNNPVCIDNSAWFCHHRFVCNMINRVVVEKLNIFTVQTGKIVCVYYSALASNGCFRNQEVPILSWCVILSSLLGDSVQIQYGNWRNPFLGSNRGKPGTQSETGKSSEEGTEKCWSIQGWASLKVNEPGD